MSQMPDKIWLHKDTKYSTADTVCGYQYDFVQGIEDEGGIENFVKYVPADAFIEKACEWLKNNAYFHVNDLTGSLDEIRLIEDFKKAMMGFEDEDDFVDEYNKSAHKVADMIGDFVYHNHINISNAIKGCELAIEQLGGTY